MNKERIAAKKLRHTVTKREKLRRGEGMYTLDELLREQALRKKIMRVIRNRKQKK